MALKKGVETIYGGAPIRLFEPAVIYDILKKYDINRIDSAHAYEMSEEILGKSGAPKDFKIDTKVPGFKPKILAKDSILSSMQESLSRLGVDKVDTYYFHSPDTETPIAESLEAINELYKEGKFKQFGLSNFSPEQVQEAYDVSKANGYVLPTIYQGNYNAFARTNEFDLIPLLRKLGMSFRAYSPIAGGFLTKSAQDVKNKALSGRWDPNSQMGALYYLLYSKPEMIEALDEYEKICQDSGIPKGAVAYRWITYHSALKPESGDGVIIGHTALEQLEEACKWIQDGPLPEDIADKVDKLWGKIASISSRDNYSAYLTVFGK